MRTCVNGIVRFSKKGDFNNSFHLSRKGMLPPRFAKSFAIGPAHIQGMDFRIGDFERTTADTKSGDFIILTRRMLGTSSDTLAISISTDSTVFSKA